MLKIRSILSIFLLVFFIQVGSTHAQYIGVCAANDYNCANNSFGQSGYIQQSSQKYPELCAVFSRTFGIGEQGEDVKRLQVVLGQEGIAYLGATGYFGPVTKSAVKIFQLRNGIGQTGAVGPITLARMRALWCSGGGYNPNQNYNTSSNGPVEVTIAPVNSSNTNVTIGWNSRNAYSCSINGRYVQTNGQQIFDIEEESSLSITCIGYNSQRVTKTIVVKPNQTVSNLPTVNLSINPSSALINTYATLYWTSTNAYSCTLNGQAVQVVGSQQIYVTDTKTAYQLSCMNQTGQSVSSTVYSDPSSDTETNTGTTYANITASTNTVSAGSPVTLNWTSGGTSYCTITGGGSTYYGLSGTQLVYPSVTTTYAISCNPNISGSTLTNQVTVYVNGSNTGNITTNLYASLTSLNPGQSSTLTWNSTNASYCNLYSNSNSMLNNQTTNGSYIVYPSITTNYQVTCYNSAGQSTSSYININVTGSSNTPTVSVSPTSSSINNGQSQALVFQVSNASYCQLNGGIYSNSYYSGNTLGAVTVNPTQTTTYTATCYGSNGTTNTASATVTVNNPNTPTITITPETQTIPLGQTAQFSILATNVTSCTITGGALSGASQGINSVRSVTPTQTTTYTITCTGTYGQVVKNATVNINNNMTLDATVDKSTINLGQTAVITTSTTNVTSCTIQGGEITTATAMPVNGTKIVKPTSNSVYAISCKNSGGNISDTVQVNVNKDPNISVTPATQSILLGQSATFAIATANIKTCTIIGGSYLTATSVATNTNVTVSPKVNTTYTVSCVNVSGGTSSATATVNVDNSPSVELRASAISINIGQSVTLTASTSRVTSCTISGPGIATSTAISPTNGTKVVTPTQTSTYKLSCTGVGGTAEATKDITVDDGATLNIVPPTQTINYGQTAKFQIQGVGINTCKISGGTFNNTAQSLNTDISVTLTATTTYTATCNRLSGGQIIKPFEIDVNDEPTLSVTPATQTILPGKTANIAIATTNVNTCTISGGGLTNTSLVINGTKTLTPPANATSTTYRVNCIGKNSTKTKSADTVVVVNSTPSVVVTPATQTISANASAILNINAENVTSCKLSGGSYLNYVLSSFANYNYYLSTPVSTIYTVNCTGTYGAASASSTVTVQ